MRGDPTADRFHRPRTVCADKSPRVCLLFKYRELLEIVALCTKHCLAISVLSQARMEEAVRSVFGGFFTFQVRDACDVSRTEQQG